MEDKGGDSGGRGGQSKEKERRKWKREGDHGCHVVSYSICCIAEQSGAAGGGQASVHGGGGRREETERERGGGGNQPSTSPQPGREAQRDRPRRRHSVSHIHGQRRTDERLGQRVEVRGRKLVRDGGKCTPPVGRQVHSGPGKKKQGSTGQGSPKVFS